MFIVLEKPMKVGGKNIICTEACSLNWTKSRLT